MKTLLFAAAAFAALLSCCVIKSNNPVLEGSEWVNVEEMFVADAGTMTITHSLKFTGSKDVTVGWKSYLPAHPAMYVNSDGKVDVIPASESEFFKKGSYVFKKGILKITVEDDTVLEYRFQDGNLFAKTPPDGKVFSRAIEY